MTWLPFSNFITAVKIYGWNLTQKGNKKSQILPISILQDKYISCNNHSYHKIIWKPPSQRELTPMLFNTGLTHLGLEAFN